MVFFSLLFNKQVVAVEPMGLVLAELDEPKNFTPCVVFSAVALLLGQDATDFSWFVVAVQPWWTGTPYAVVQPTMYGETWLN